MVRRDCYARHWCCRSAINNILFTRLIKLLSQLSVRVHIYWQRWDKESKKGGLTYIYHNPPHVAGTFSNEHGITWAARIRDCCKYLGWNSNGRAVLVRAFPRLSLSLSNRMTIAYMSLKQDAESYDMHLRRLEEMICLVGSGHCPT